MKYPDIPAKFDLEYCKTLFSSADEIKKLFPDTMSLSQLVPNMDSSAQNISKAVVRKITVEGLRELLQGRDDRLKDLHRLQTPVMSVEAINLAREFIEKVYDFIVTHLWIDFCKTMNLDPNKKIEEYPNYKNEFQTFIQEKITRRHVLLGIMMLFRHEYGLMENYMGPAISFPHDYPHTSSAKDVHSLIKCEIARVTFTLIPDLQKEEEIGYGIPTPLEEFLEFSLEELREMAKN